MVRKLYLVFLILGFSTIIAWSQSIATTSDLFKSAGKNRAGKLNVIQDPALDTLLNRYILSFINLEAKNNGTSGMDGYRIQIYSNSARNAREESGKIRAEFMSKFPDIDSYPLFEKPGYYKIRVGDFRSKAEATKPFLLISKVFPNAYIVPDFINFPDQNTK
jgi:hypothetical protein